MDIKKTYDTILNQIKTLLTDIKTLLTDKTQFTKITDGTDTLAIDVNGNAQVGVASSVLPTGAATEATLATLATQATLATAQADIATMQDDIALIKADVTAMLGNQTDGDQKTQVTTLPELLEDEFNIKHFRILSDNMFDGAPVVIDSEHHEIHCGDRYCGVEMQDLSGSTTTVYRIVVPDELVKRFHFLFSILFESEVEWRLKEGTTFTVNGSTLNQYNRERNSANTTGLIITTGATINVAGTLIDGEHFGSGRNSGGESRGQREWVLKNNTVYSLEVQNFSASANHITARFEHYIHPGI